MTRLLRYHTCGYFLNSVALIPPNLTHKQILYTSYLNQCYFSNIWLFNSHRPNTKQNLHISYSRFFVWSPLSPHLTHPTNIILISCIGGFPLFDPPSLAPPYKLHIEHTILTSHFGDLVGSSFPLFDIPPPLPLLIPYLHHV
jgi:hypothetical protein